MLSILPVQTQLGAFEVAAQADLVRVLTHEIMNSLTPVTSLARSGAEMVAAAEDRGADLGDARVATETVARRAEGLLRFVESYREFAQKPEVHRQSIPAKLWAQEILQLAMANVGERHVDVSAEVKPETLRLQADPDLLAQALLNLLRNALRVVAKVERPLIRYRSAASATVASASRCGTTAPASLRTGARTSSCPSTLPIKAAAASVSASHAK